MERFDVEIKRNCLNLRRLGILLHFIPIMEAIEKLENVVIRYTKKRKKVHTDLKYIRHEMDLLEQDARIFFSLKNKKNESRNCKP
jgi:hypothetical protein